MNLRSYYFNRDKVGQADSIGLSQALSEYAYDLLGFDASLFSSQMLSGEAGRVGTGLLQDERGSQRGYSKLGRPSLN